VSARTRGTLERSRDGFDAGNPRSGLLDDAELLTNMTDGLRDLGGGIGPGAGDVIRRPAEGKPGFRLGLPHYLLRDPLSDCPF
jgi:hypothetical protein